MRTGRLRRNLAVVGCLWLLLVAAGCALSDPEAQSPLLGAAKNDSGQRVLLLSRCAGLGTFREIWGGEGGVSADEIEFRLTLARDDSRESTVNLDAP